MLGAAGSAGAGSAEIRLSMYWFQDIESARALARMWTKSPQPACDDAAPLTDEPAADDVTPQSQEDVSVTPYPAR